MGIKFKIPKLLQEKTDGAVLVEVQGGSVQECIADLIRRFPALEGMILDEEDRILLRWMVYINRLMMGIFAGMGFYLSPLTTGIRLVWAKAKKIVLPKGTRMRNLIGRNPANLDTQNLELTPLEEFETVKHQVGSSSALITSILSLTPA